MSSPYEVPATLPIPTDPTTGIRQGILLLLLFLGGFVFWSATAPLNEGVPLPGRLVVDGNRKPVQHLSGGIVATLNVREGDRVRGGDLLLQLDTSTLAGQRDVLGSQLQGVQARVAGLRDQIPLRQTQIRSIQDDLQRLQPLVAEGLYPANRHAEQQRQLSELQAQLRLEQAELRQGQTQLQELREKLSVVSTDLVRTDIRAPVDGTVLGLTVHAAGAVVPPGGTMLELVPSHQPVMIESQVLPHQIESVRAGLPVQLRFTALDQRRTPVIEGEVRTVSADLIQDERGNTYFTARIAVPADQLQRLGKVILQPGMPVESIVVTGERTFLDYLLKPLRDSFAKGLKER